MSFVSFVFCIVLALEAGRAAVSQEHPAFRVGQASQQTAHFRR
jgi:hypothetical protein